MLHLMLAPSSENLLFPGCLDLSCTKLRYDQDEEVYGEGTEPEFVYKVVSGAVRAQKLLSDGRRQIVAFHLPGDIFGLELSSMRGLSAEAVADTRLLVLERKALEQVAAQNIDVARQLAAHTTRSLDDAQEHILLLGRKMAGERVAAFLLEMDQRMRPAGAMRLPMSRSDIADYLGLTMETVSRAISEFKGRGLVTRFAARKIKVNGRSKLRTIDAQLVVGRGNLAHPAGPFASPAS